MPARERGIVPWRLAVLPVVGSPRLCAARRHARIDMEVLGSRHHSGYTPEILNCSGVAGGRSSQGPQSRAGYVLGESIAADPPTSCVARVPCPGTLPAASRNQSLTDAIQVGVIVEG
jgi:hypothetical protein